MECCFRLKVELTLERAAHNFPVLEEMGSMKPGQTLSHIPMTWWLDMLGDHVVGLGDDLLTDRSLAHVCIDWFRGGSGDRWCWVPKGCRLIFMIPLGPLSTVCWKPVVCSFAPTPAWCVLDWKKNRANVEEAQWSLLTRCKDNGQGL